MRLVAPASPAVTPIAGPAVIGIGSATITLLRCTGINGRHNAGGAVAPLPIRFGHPCRNQHDQDQKDRGDKSNRGEAGHDTSAARDLFLELGRLK